MQAELELYVAAGIRPPAALKMTPYDAARIMGGDDRLGTIEPGKLADWVLVRDDPTRDIGSIRRVEGS